MRYRITNSFSGISSIGGAGSSVPYTHITDMPFRKSGGKGKAMQTLRDGTRLSDRRWEELMMELLLEDLETSYCRSYSHEYYEFYPEYADGKPYYIENILNYKDIRVAEEYVITNGRVYKPAFEFIGHKGRRRTVPVFLETTDLSEDREEELLEKYRDICLSCREIVILCGYPFFGRRSTETSSEELRDMITETIERLFAAIKREKTEHETMTVKLIAENSYLDEDNIPDCTVLSLRAFHFPKKAEEKLTDRKIKVTVTAVLDEKLVKEGMFEPLNVNEDYRKRAMKIYNAFNSFKFSLDKRHHYSPHIFFSHWDYTDGILTLVYKEEYADQEPLLRYLLSHPADEVKAIKRPVFDPYSYSPLEDEYSYVPLARSAETKITGVVIEYSGNTYKIY